ncbi:protein COFACTOR ASSEMBLY OF COMPLEX C SUBUNIT B CCB2, chloroplastic [Quillaja saponaria]|uniref:Protein COFACTOR ASSEMBLY OF COMPLEX C SUBUNIT B CCB2, chloroplastic n=1 Tax=Quillaja saponaria TaxID=32244 RepID=A0AAD7Q695_QUISA|nr:protein COFACTOR ASSEMBLY OF COMPLEX C SUBUNIT B CCB2, chloroplastic [Quillaja saponaria]
MSSVLSFNPFLPLKIPSQFRAKTRTRKLSISSRFENSQRPTDQQQQLNLSVLRFTLGIPGLDESYLPRWIGYGFGSLLLLNHFVGLDSTATTPAQLRTEVLGVTLASFSIALPYIGKFLKGAKRDDPTTLPEGTEQIFILSQNVSDTQKEDMAWASYILLRNTNATSVLISIRGEICVRGYWNIPNDSSKDSLLGWFEKKVENIGLSDLKDTLYFPQDADTGLLEMLPKGTSSLLIEPVLQQVPKQNATGLGTTKGFVLLASTTRYAFSSKDRAWIAAVASKFKVKNLQQDC